MAKLWNGKKKQIEVFRRGYGGKKRERIASFLADDVISSSPRMYFYYNGEEAYFYDERECCHTVSDLKER